MIYYPDVSRETFIKTNNGQTEKPTARYPFGCGCERKRYGYIESTQHYRNTEQNQQERMSIFQF